MLVFEGKTAKFYLRGVRNVHGPIRGRFRVMWPDFRAKYLETIRGSKDNKEAELWSAKAVASLLSEWNVTYPNDHPNEDLRGKPVPITPDVLLKECYPPTYNRLMNVVLGMSEGDIDPDDSIEDQLKTVDNQNKSAEELQQMLAKIDAEKVGN